MSSYEDFQANVELAKLCILCIGLRFEVSFARFKTAQRNLGRPLYLPVGSFPLDVPSPEHTMLVRRWRLRKLEFLLLATRA